MTPAALLAAALIAFPASDPVKPRTLTIDAHEFAYTMPDSVPAGVYTIELNNGGKEEHHAVFIRLEQGKRLADLMAAMGPDGPFPSWATFVGGPEGPMPHGNVTLPLKPGRYAIICFIPSADGMPHLAKGMSKELLVTGKKLEGSMPRADAELSLQDYSFRFSKPLKAGRQTIDVLVRNGQPHEIAIHRLEPGKTATDFVRWLAKPEGPPPATLHGGIAPLAAGETAQFTVDLPPGTYALICHIPDHKDGKAHLTHGMWQEVTI
ncbi:MAG TPA: hypothetical protein VFX50_15750, partial [Gemmatimonadales bacterium]|nr:hypothetical protein [Gemmatimonadales bacterium]